MNVADNLLPQNDSLVSKMVKNPVAANLIMALCIIGGYFLLGTLKQEVFPAFEVDAVQVEIVYPNASPSEINDGIILSVEDAISSVEGVDDINSTAVEGMAIVRADALKGTDLQTLSSDIQQEIDTITTLPDDAETPRVTILKFSKRVLSIAVAGDMDQLSLNNLSDKIADELYQYKEINKIEFQGKIAPQININISSDTLQKYNLTFAKISQIIKQFSINKPAGSVKTQQQEILIRMQERKNKVHEFARIPIVTSTDGSILYLSDIATITDGFEDDDYMAIYNNKPAILLDIYSDENISPITSSKVVKKYLKDLKNKLPKNVIATIRYDRSKVLKQRIDLLLENAGLGLILVLIILSFFLEIRLAFWVMLGIPIAFLGSFLILPFFDVSINMISLFAYIISLGIVVDDAIILGENIYSHRKMGKGSIRAAIDGTKEMARPITFSIMTNIVAFMPLYFMSGVMGKIFSIIPVVVGTVFLFSLLEALFILPAHLGGQHHKTRRNLSLKIHHQQQKFSQKLQDFVDKKYAPLLDFALSNKTLSLMLTMGILILSLSYAISGRMGMEMFPKQESDYSKFTLTMPFGTPFEETKKIISRVIQKAQKSNPQDGYITGIFAEIGKKGSHNAMVRVYLADPDIREKIQSTGDYTKVWRKKVGKILSAETYLFESDAGGPGAGKSLSVELNDNDMTKLKEASSYIAKQLQKYPEVSDIDDGFNLGKLQYDLKLTNKAHVLGFSSQDIANQIRNSLYGIETIRQMRGNDELKVLLRLPENERSTEQNLSQMKIFNKDGTVLFLSELAHIHKTRAYTKIQRHNGRQVIDVTAAVSPRSTVDLIVSDLKSHILPKMQEKFPTVMYSFEGQQADMRESIGSLKQTYPLALLVIFGMLAMVFKSYLQPLIVMMAIPFGLVGAIIGHFIMGYSLSIVSMLGLVALTGIVINDSLILIDYANSLKDKIKDTRVRIITAGKQRFRPILLTTLTTFAGLMPMMLETSRQAKILIPMAISLAFGIVFATMITLFLVPILYQISESIRSKF
ncbi:MAG: AcrB/AcrD/AcrF family protein [Gammaproteobacteria bacterium]|nr:MAG: AcrB/AcrD/AcrF family protein [Gammaproteobacteria bacterium]